MLPKSRLSNAGPLLPKRVSSATPSAKDAVVTTPMAASAPMRFVRATALMARAEASPHSPAPSEDRDAEQRRGGVPAEDGVREAVADVAHALEGDEHAEQPAQRSGQRRGHEALDEELVAERVDQRLPEPAHQPARFVVSMPSALSTTRGTPRCCEDLHPRAEDLLDDRRHDDLGRVCRSR